MLKSQLFFNMAVLYFPAILFHIDRRTSPSEFWTTIWWVTNAISTWRNLCFRHKIHELHSSVIDCAVDRWKMWYNLTSNSENRKHNWRRKSNTSHGRASSALEKNNRFDPSNVSNAAASEHTILLQESHSPSACPSVRNFLASQDALEVMLVIHWLR